MSELPTILICWAVALSVELPIVFLIAYIARDKNEK